MTSSIRRSISLALATAALAALNLSAQTAAQTAAPVDPRAYAGLTWRNLGPFRGGRTAAVTGALGQPGVFYIGTPAGGVWKTTSAGEVWYPVFDGIKEVSSVGSVEVAPSDANVVYAGMGDIITGGSINEGNGVYKSTDAGRSWRHMGLDGTKQIPSMLVDPNNPSIVMVAAQGDIHAKSHDRGVFRSTDGGATWTQTLFVDDSTGAQKLARAFDVPNTIFLTTVAHYQAPPVPGQAYTPGGGGGGGRGGRGGAGPTSTKLFKSTDGGVTWTEILGHGLPERLTGKLWVAVAMHTNAQRVYVIGDGGLYRSDDGGATWRQMAADDQRIRNGQGGYNCGVYVSPDNPDVVYTLNTASYRSTDGGRTFTGFKGAPGGDDPQQMWIDPTNGQRILFGYDQGAIVSLDGGQTWSSWYNQSTEQIYHLNTDNSFPYWVYGSQQDAGAIRQRSRGNYGEITALDWSPVPGWEWGTVTPDPLNPNTVFGSGSGIVKMSYPSEMWISVSPHPSQALRTTSSQPLMFTPWNQHMLITGFQSVWATTDSGEHWNEISPDLTVLPGQVTPPPGQGFGPAGAIESLGASSVGSGIIWAGTNDGMAKVTRDGGKSWAGGPIDTSIPNWERGEVAAVDPSHLDAAEAYAAIDQHRVGDYTPYIYRTRDFGKSWTRITNGLPTHQPGGSFVRVVRNDTQRRGLLIAGTESGIFVSFDDGDHWQTLQQNAPTTSYRDLKIKDNDLVFSTYGRGFWVLDDYSMLRQVTPAITSEAAHLFKPGDAYRVRRNVNADTPFPPEVPHALNPEPGVVLDYWLASAPTSEITIDVLDGSGALVRHMSSTPEAPVAEAARPPEPNFWIAPPFALPKNAGENRSNWDLRYDAPKAVSHSFEINANPGQTPPSPEGPVAIPGAYTIKLTADGRTYTQQVAVKPDPRSPASPGALQQQHLLQMKLLAGLNSSYDGRSMAMELRDALRSEASAADMPDVAAKAAAMTGTLDTLIEGGGGRRGGGGGGGGRGGGGAPQPPNFGRVNQALINQMNAQDLGDMAPTPAAVGLFEGQCQELHTAAAMWTRVSTTDLSALNGMLTQRGKPAIKAPAGALDLPVCAR